MKAKRSKLNRNMEVFYQLKNQEGDKLDYDGLSPGIRTGQLETGTPEQ